MVRRYKQITSQDIESIVKSESDVIIEELMKKFDSEIVSYEDADDPARPSLCRDEFREFLRENIISQIKIVPDGVEIGVGDDSKLGFNAELDEDTTDCLKIIGTIMQGVVGDYVLVTSEMTGGPEGRFGKAFILPVEEYKIEAPSKGWDPNRPIWRFSNFKGIPDFFEGIDLKVLIENVVKKIIEAIKKR